VNKFLLLSVLIIFSVSIGYFLGGQRLFEQGQRPKIQSQAVKKPILRVALVADSHNENELLAKALSQAGGKGVNFVIGLGDYTNVGTVEELRQAREVFDRSKLEYLVTVGDHDLWDSRNRGEDPLTNFREVFDDSTRVLEREGIQFVILDNSDIYSGIDSESWKLLNDSLSGYIGQDGQTSENVKCQMSNVKCAQPRLRFVFAQKTPFHPESKHVMGKDSEEVSRQARKLIDLLEEKKVDGFFSGDLHFFAEFKSPAQIVKMTTVGAVAAERNFQGPRFAMLTVFDDYSWEVEDIEIRMDANR